MVSSVIHLRDYAENLSTIGEALEITRRSGVSLQLSDYLVASKNKGLSGERICGYSMRQSRAD
jgi:hypothetical protein